MSEYIISNRLPALLRGKYAVDVTNKAPSGYYRYRRTLTELMETFYDGSLLLVFKKQDTAQNKRRKKK